MKTFIAVLLSLFSLKIMAFNEVCSSFGEGRVARLKHSITLNLEKADLTIAHNEENFDKRQIQKYLRRIDNDISRLRTLESEKVCPSLKKATRSALIEAESKQKDLENFVLGLGPRPAARPMADIVFQEV